MAPMPKYCKTFLAMMVFRVFVYSQKVGQVAETRNISVGDVVVLHEDNMIPTKWPLGRVIETYSGSDGLVRVVRVKTQNGTFKRPVHKLAVLLESEI